MDSKVVTINYTNWKGITADREILPIKIFYGHTPWHKDDQWLLRALDIAKGEERDFALKDIHSWI
jgi:predicted DNA-binding transcriptional regulator YafY